MVLALYLLQVSFMENKFELALVDGSFMLKRSAAMVAKGRDPKTVRPGEILTLIIQTLRKAARDYGITCSKYIFVWDQWKPEWGGYWRTYLMKDFGNYKGTRSYWNEEKIESLRRDPEVSAFELAGLESEYEMHCLREKTKRAIVEDFWKLGILSYEYPGYEADDIITLATHSLLNHQTSPYVIISKDTDLHYSLTPMTYFYKVGSKEEDLVGYDQMWEKVPMGIKATGISLYQYKAYLESLSVTHNDMTRTLKPGKDVNMAILKIMDGDFSDLSDPLAFKAQFGTFDLWSFPDVDQVLSDISGFPVRGIYPDMTGWNEVRKKYGIFRISDDYFYEFSKGFDQKLFCDR